MTQSFLRDVLSNPNNARLLERWESVRLPDAWLVAGCLFQTVWNLRAGQTPDAGIKDYDLFYFDASDLSAQSERAHEQAVQTLFADLNITLEVCNQARVHLWYEAHFGHPSPPLRSSRDGIDRFLVTCTCVGVRPGEVYAPYGLAALYAGELAMNPLTPHRALYDEKAASYQRRWPWLRRETVAND